MFDFLIGLAFVVMVIGPAILASIQRSKSHDDDGASDTEAAGNSEGAAVSASDAGNAAATGTNDAHGSKLDL